MIRFRKYGGIAFLLLALLLAVQAGVSLLLRTHRMRGYLVAHLESAFGRPVEVGRFSVQILPIPELDVEAVTIGEDPSFGKEYFLRAEHMTARLRWLGLLRGHFEFGTMSFSRPSLILVRNADGHWNLERWLPPAKPVAGTGTSAAVSQPRAETTYHLQKIDFDEGRINFKLGSEKRPFAFTGVSGTVEQVSSGRWHLQLEAQPWRSGVPLQSTGTLRVMGDVAGTSARLQPAQIRLHWDEVSLADLFRLVTGNDSGVRGQFALDGNASVGMGNPDTSASTWRFALQARATQIHRWDLTERDDNPRVNVNVKGLWELAAGQARADELRVELPHSRLLGTATLQTSGVGELASAIQEHGGARRRSAGVVSGISARCCRRFGVGRGDDRFGKFQRLALALGTRSDRQHTRYTAFAGKNGSAARPVSWIPAKREVRSRGSSHEASRGNVVTTK